MEGVQNASQDRKFLCLLFLWPVPGVSIEEKQEFFVKTVSKDIIS